MSVYVAFLWVFLFLGVGFIIVDGLRRLYWGRSSLVDHMKTLTEQRDKSRATSKFLVSQIKGFKKAGGELLSLTIKSLDSIDKDKLRTIRRFRSLLTWADKYMNRLA